MGELEDQKRARYVGEHQEGDLSMEGSGMLI